MLATDGLWDVMEHPEEAVKFVQDAAKNNSKLTKPIRSKAAAKRTWMNPSKRLVMEGIRRLGSQFITNHILKFKVVVKI